MQIHPGHNSSTRLRLLPLLLAATLAACPAQTPAPDTIIQKQASLVLVDVVVTANGKPVHNLPRERFHIFENGKEQKINSFEETSSTAQIPPSATSTVSKLPPNTYTDVPDHPSTGPANILLLDALNTPSSDQLQVRRQMMEYLRTIAPGTRLAIFSLSSRLRLLQGFTADPAVLLNAAKNNTPRASAPLDTTAIKTLGDIANDQSALGAYAETVSMMQQFEADQNAFQVDMRIRLTLDAMQQLARYLGAIPGRKNLIWFSGSFPIQLDPDDSLESPFQAARAYAEDMRAVSTQLAASRIAVYPIDARGLMTLPMSDASYSAGSSSLAASASAQKPRNSGTRATSGGTSQINKDYMAFVRSTVDEHASMQQVAEDTGGHAFLDSNGLKQAIDTAIALGSNYYTLAYSPPTQAPTPHTAQDFRKLRIELSTPDTAGGTPYTLAYRRGYYTGRPQPLAHTEAIGMVAAATLHGVPVASQVQFRVRVLPIPSAADTGNPANPTAPAGELPLPGKATRYAMDFTINAGNLAVASDATGRGHAKVELIAIAYDASGKRLNFLDKGFDLKIPAVTPSAPATDTIPMHQEIDLPPGRVDLRIAVRDLASNRVGSIEIPLQVTTN